MAVVEAPVPTTRVDVEDVLRSGGFTGFHRRAVAVTGFAWTFVAMEILLVGFTVPVFTAIWGISGSLAGWITASALAGSLVGSVVFGRLADRIGRRRIFVSAILWYASFTALTALAWGPWSVSGLPLPRGDRARCPARRRSVDALRVSAPAEPRPLSRLPRLLLACRAPPRDRALVGLPRSDRRRLRLALPLPRCVVPCLSRLPRAPLPAGEPVLACSQRSYRRGRRRARGDHRRPGRRRGDRGERPAEELCQ